MTTSTTVWTALPSAASTRVLVLHPARSGDRHQDALGASLLEVVFHDAGARYEAILYTWDKGHNQQLMYIGGHELLIKEKLWHFLRT